MGIGLRLELPVNMGSVRTGREQIAFELFALWISGSVYRAKSCTSVFLVCMFLFVPSHTFAVVCIV